LVDLDKCTEFVQQFDFQESSVSFDNPLQHKESFHLLMS
jgi:hypothetical protein